MVEKNQIKPLKINGDEFLNINTSNDVFFENYLKQLLILGPDNESVKNFKDPNYIIKTLHFEYDLSEKYCLKPGMEILTGSVKDTSLIAFLMGFKYYGLVKHILSNFEIEKIVDVKNKELSYYSRSNFKDEFSATEYTLKDFNLSHLMFEKDSETYYSESDNMNVINFYKSLIKEDKQICSYCEFNYCSNIMFGLDVPSIKGNNLNSPQVKEKYLEIVYGIKNKSKNNCKTNLNSIKEKNSKKEK